jgi:hypothetical protein
MAAPEDLHALKPYPRLQRRLERHSEAASELHQAAVQEAERLALLRESEPPPPGP